MDHAANENKEMEDLLNNYIVSVITREEEDNMLEIPGLRLTRVNVSKKSTLAILMALKIDKSPGIDGFHPSF